MSSSVKNFNSKNKKVKAAEPKPGKYQTKAAKSLEREKNEPKPKKG